MPEHPGAGLGIPAEGPGAMAPAWRRIAGITLDWFVALLVARLVLRDTGLGSFAPLLVLLVEQTLLVGTLGTAIGHRVVGVHVTRVDGGPPGPLRAAVRSALLCLAVPALVWDRDQRGLHDKAAGTVIVRA